MIQVVEDGIEGRVLDFENLSLEFIEIVSLRDLEFLIRRSMTIQMRNRQVELQNLVVEAKSGRSFGPLASEESKLDSM